jgi:hypothetical protein
MAHSAQMAVSRAGESSSPAPALSFPRLRWRLELTAERRYLLRANLLVFLFTFVVYWALGPHYTNYDFQLSQANNIIHGHLDMTAEYTRNLNVLERVLYDGKGFCLPVNDPRGPDSYADVVNPRITADCRSYMQHSLGPALLLVPFALVWGLDVNQAIISAAIGALAAVFVFLIVRHFTEDRRTQIALTILASFGTTYWFSAADGGVWYFAHACAVLFLFAAIWATVVRRSPLLAGALIGAAFMCRPTTLLGGVFPLIYFADDWLVTNSGVPLRERIRLAPLVKLAVGVAPFVALAAALNYARFNNLLETGYTYSEQFHQIHLASSWPYGIASINYIPLHIQAFFELMPNVADKPPFIWPSWWGLATWFTTPPILYALFVHLRRVPAIVYAGVLGLLAACGFMIFKALANGLDDPTWGNDITATGIQLLPFFLLIGAALVAAAVVRDRLVLACWGAIVAIAFADFTFAATGYAQFGYRYALDFMPFLFMLIIVAVGRRVEWHHLLLIGLGVLVNMWGVLWIFQFASVLPHGLFGWTWVSYYP